MSKKIILLALAAASVAAFGLPATAMAVEEDIPLHVVPKPEGAKTLDGEGHVSVTGSFGTITCTSSSGSVTFTTSTTGTLHLTFFGCSCPTGTATTEGQAAGTITTTLLPFHLVTVTHEHNAGAGVFPGILVTPNAETNVFTHFSCPLFPNTTITGNGVVGTITNPTCGGSSSEPTITFQGKAGSPGVQTHTTVVGTSTSYGLQAFGGAASLDMAGKITLGTAAKLECT